MSKYIKTINESFRKKYEILSEANKKEKKFYGYEIANEYGSFGEPDNYSETGFDTQQEAAKAAIKNFPGEKYRVFNYTRDEELSWQDRGGIVDEGVFDKLKGKKANQYSYYYLYNGGGSKAVDPKVPMTVELKDDNEAKKAFKNLVDNGIAVYALYNNSTKQYLYPYKATKEKLAKSKEIASDTAEENSAKSIGTKKAFYNYTHFKQGTLGNDSMKDVGLDYNNNL